MRFNKFIVLSFVSSIALFGGDKLEDVLSQSRNEVFYLSAEKATQDSQKLEKDWINPIQFSYTYTMDVAGGGGKESNIGKFNIAISQPIFKSGGIGYAIKYADASNKYAHLDIALQKKAMMKDAIKILFQLRQTDLSIKKQNLVVVNADIDVEIKKEQVIHGVMDASFLDNAIIDANAKKVALVDLQTQKTNLVNQFKNYSDKPYETLQLPVLSLLSQEEFVNNNGFIQKNQEEIIQKEWYSKMITTKYLPTINAIYNYNHFADKSDGTNDAYYGASISIPLDIRYKNETQSVKLDYLKAKANSENIKKEELNLYQTKLAKLENIDKKIALAQKDVELYKSLVFQVKELASVGLKTSTDATILENSLQIKSMDEAILKLDQQMELLELYARYHS